MDPDDEQSASPEPEVQPIVTYSLEEVAAMVLPADMGNAVAWLQVQLRSGKARGYKAGRRWRMTHADVEDFIARNRSTTPPMLESEPVERGTYPGGLTRRSWQNLQRGRPVRRPPYRGPAVENEKIRPLQNDLAKVSAEPPEVIAAMPGLTPTQQNLLNRVRSEGEVVFSGKTARKTVEALARRGLVVYDAEHVPNEAHGHYFYRFTVWPKPDKPAVGGGL